jgi:hypothetical protein
VIGLNGSKTQEISFSVTKFSAFKDAARSLHSASSPAASCPSDSSPPSDQEDAGSYEEDASEPSYGDDDEGAVYHAESEVPINSDHVLLSSAPHASLMSFDRIGALPLSAT